MTLRLLPIILVCLISCKDTNIQGNQDIVLQYYAEKPNAIFKKIVPQSEYDSVYFFYDNGNLFKKGKQYQEEQKFGIWELYDRESNLREIREWFTIKGKSRVNRVWHLNIDGDTLSRRYKDSIFQQREFVHDTTYFNTTNYDFIIYNKDTISINEPIRAVLHVGSTKIEHPNSNVRVFISGDEKNFNYDFSNDSIVKLTQFHDLTKDSINRKWFDHLPYNRTVAFGRWYKSPGDKILRGYYQQYVKGPFNKDGEVIDSIVSYKTYIEKRIHVLDTVK